MRMYIKGTPIVQMPSRSQLLAGVRKLEVMVQAATTVNELGKIIPYYRILHNGLAMSHLVEDAHYVWRVMNARNKQLSPAVVVPESLAPSGAVVELKLKEIT